MVLSNIGVFFIVDGKISNIFIFRKKKIEKSELLNYWYLYVGRWYFKYMIDLGFVERKYLCILYNVWEIVWNLYV